MASTYLSRTPASAGNRKTFTFSAWIKRSALGGNKRVFTAGNNGTELVFNTSDALTWYYFNGSYIGQYFAGTNSTNRLFRDTSAWYHIVLSVDTTQATASNRVKIYINGLEETVTSTQIPQNTDVDYNNTIPHYVGKKSDSNSDYFDGSMSHIHFIDGTAYDASTFGETDATTGIWKPKTAPSVTYGTNGFFLKFENSGAFGTDSSGNANNFTVNGTMTQTIDTPSNVFATLNPLNVPSANAPTFQYGNTESTTPGSTGRFGGTSTLGMSKGKYYWEAKYIITALPRGEFGITYDPSEQAINNATASNYADAWCYQSEAGYIRNNSTNLDTEATYTNGDIVMCALDLDNNYVYFGKNGTWVNSGDPTSGSSGTGGYSITANKTYFSITADNTSGSDQQTYQFNFGNGYFGTTVVSSAQNPDDGIGIFEYAVPTGYKALCTKSINAQEYD